MLATPLRVNTSVCVAMEKPGRERLPTQHSHTPLALGRLITMTQGYHMYRCCSREICEDKGAPSRSSCQLRGEVGPGKASGHTDLGNGVWRGQSPMELPPSPSEERNYPARLGSEEPYPKCSFPRGSEAAKWRIDCCHLGPLSAASMQSQDTSNQ